MNVQTYLPTITNLNNMDSVGLPSSPNSESRYVQDDDWVHVWGALILDATAAGWQASWQMTLPVPSTFEFPSDLRGTFNASIAQTGGHITGNVASGKATFQYTPQFIGGGFTINYQLSYQVKPTP